MGRQAIGGRDGQIELQAVGACSLTGRDQSATQGQGNCASLPALSCGSSVVGLDFGESLVAEETSGANRTGGKGVTKEEGSPATSYTEQEVHDSDQGRV